MEFLNKIKCVQFFKHKWQHFKKNPSHLQAQQVPPLPPTNISVNKDLTKPAKIIPQVEIKFNFIFIPLQQRSPACICCCKLPTYCKYNVKNNSWHIRLVRNDLSLSQEFSLLFYFQYKTYMVEKHFKDKKYYFDI